MLGSLKRRVAVATAVGLLGMTGSALAAGSASAAVYHINYGSASGTPVPVGTTYQASSTSIGLVSPTSPYGPIVTCSGTSTLSGATDTIGGGTASAGLTVTGGSFSTCKINASGLAVTVTGNYSPAWQVTPTGGTSSPFTGTVSNVSATIACGSGNSATFTGTLSTGGSETDASPASYITLTHASSLTKTTSTGTGCALPSTVDVTGMYTLTQTNGSPVTSATNFWLSYS